MSLERAVGVSIDRDILTTSQAVDYETLRPQIRNGDILLFSGSELFSRAIRWATNSPFSHVGFIFRIDAIDRIFVLQSLTSAGACTVALSAIVNGVGPHQPPYHGRLVVARHDDFVRLANRRALRSMSEFAVDRFGAPYSRIEIAKIVIRIALGKLNIKLPATLQPDDEYICSEYAAACFKALGIDFQWDGLGFIAPADFAEDPKVKAVGVIATARTAS